MRMAALTAGLIDEGSSDWLQLALEPEAACVACKQENSNLKEKDSFMVLDCGGGTVEIIIHHVAKKQPHLRLDELATPSVGPYGSSFVDLEFESFFRNLVGFDAFDRLKPSGEWVQLMRMWETAKLSFHSSTSSTTAAVAWRPPRL